MTQCFLLPAEVRMKITDAQAEHPFAQDELQQLRALWVGEETTPEGEEDKGKPSTGTISSSDSDSVSPVPGNGQKGELEEPPLQRPSAEDMGTQERLAR